MPTEENKIADVPQWHAAGDWFDVCKCNIPCPCTFAQPPTSGDCEGVLAWHIREGHYGDGSLRGLNVVAEGVTTGEQVSFLLRNQIDQMQGPYFCRPCPADECTSLIRAGKVPLGPRRKQTA